MDGTLLGYEVAVVTVVEVDLIVTVAVVVVFLAY